ncbi:outer membrane protein assembly factor BamE [Saccharibacter sp. 17.LH.SD]|uniref:outer membrane protein assembly factor BamE n=1 Tax=Saccharibacter sp. 17.LH.SD TaxID=2689393 RepID=UPI00136A0D3A|nr:outer membrane protein assembly factor BamE [Saccharibacter sp. 17.LH.SD]MXV44630.1 outer membrane protein assembly factor BamE [Saccharibacter sp. 17.LH.SD]
MTSVSSATPLRRYSRFLTATRCLSVPRSRWVGLLAGGIIFLSGCAAPIPRGALIEKEDYSQLIPNTSTQSDTLGILGSPTTHSTFNDNTWIYISMTKDLVPLSHPAVATQNVLVLNFDNNGVLRKKTVLGRHDAIPVRMVNAVTPTPGTQISVIQELLGNVGRYNPMSSMGSTFGGLNGGNGMGGVGGGGGMGMGQGSGTGNGGVGNTMP